MRGYFREIGLPGTRLARRCGVSHSQIFMARKRNVGQDNAEKISRGVAAILGLSERERLELKAEIMGHPGNLLRAWLGNAADVERLLDVPHPTAAEILDPEKAITHKSGARALERLQVVLILKKVIPGMTYKKATRIMYEAHTQGKATVKRCLKELAELYKERLEGECLAISLEPAR